jgi:DNA-binding response OmpR family regulator
MKKLLLVDADPLSLCMLDVSLRKSGYGVTTATDGADASAKMSAISPDLLLTDTRLPKLDGFGLVRRLKELPESAAVPVIFLASQESIADRERALELGVEDYIAKPVYLCELTARIDLLIARSARRLISSIEGPTMGLGRLTGSTEDFALVDLLQHFERTRKSGLVSLLSGMQQAQVWFRDGKVVDARLGAVRGEEAIYRALLWGDASFEIELRAVANEDIIGTSTPTLLMKGMRRVDDWVRLCDQVQPLATLLDVQPAQLVDRLSRMSGSAGDLQGMLRMLLRPSTDSAPPVIAGRADGGERAMRAAVESAIVAAPRVASPPPPPAIAAAAPPPALVASPPAPAVVASPPTPVVVAPPPAPAVVASPHAPAVQAVRAAGASPVLAVVVPRAPADSVAPSPAPVRATPSHRPSSAPWTREIGPATEPGSEVEELAAGVPRAMGTSAKRGAMAAAAVAGLLLVAGGVYSMNMRQQRESEEARSGNDRVAAAAQASASVEAVAAPAPSAPEVAAAPPSSAAVAAVESAPPPEPAPAPATTANAVAAPPGPPVVAAAATPVADLAFAAPRAPRATGSNARETALDVKSSLNSKSPLVRDAELALLKGDTNRAQALSQQAVAANPSDADGWLTLAAARKASGDLPAAREAYLACIEQAHTLGLEHCRILAEGR